jgi:NADH dehydrogenase
MFEKPIRPVPVGELTKVLVAAVHGALENESVAVLGAEELSLSEAVRRVGVIVDRRVIVFPLPILFHKVLAQFTEWTMKVPLVAKAQVRMLAEGVTEPGYKTVELPESLKPKLPFWGEHVDKELPERRAFGMRDLRIPQFLKHN